MKKLPFAIALAAAGLFALSACDDNSDEPVDTPTIVTSVSPSASVSPVMVPSASPSESVSVEPSASVSVSVSPSDTDENDVPDHGGR